MFRNVAAAEAIFQISTSSAGRINKNKVSISSGETSKEEEVNWESYEARTEGPWNMDPACGDKVIALKSQEVIEISLSHVTPLTRGRVIYLADDISGSELRYSVCGFFGTCSSNAWIVFPLATFNHSFHFPCITFRRMPWRILKL